MSTQVTLVDDTAPLKQELHAAECSTPAAAAVEAMQIGAPFSAHRAAGQWLRLQYVCWCCAARKGSLHVEFGPPWRRIEDL